MKIPKDMISGTIHKTKLNGDLIIVEYQNSVSVKVRFISTGYETTTRSVHIRTGTVKDTLYASVFVIGFLGVGEYSVIIKGKKCPAYVAWKHILERCYSERELLRRPTYRGCSVAKEWHNFQNFAKWYEENHPNDGNRYDIDKDLLEFKNKVYSPSTCCFVQVWLNTLTLDCGSSRGEYPIGASFRNTHGDFLSQCSVSGKRKHLGYFLTALEAHSAWLSCKLGHALALKPRMDLIDLRIYPNVIQIIREAK